MVLPLLCYLLPCEKASRNHKIVLLAFSERVYEKIRIRPNKIFNFINALLPQAKQYSSQILQIPLLKKVSNNRMYVIGHENSILQ